MIKGKKKRLPDEVMTLDEFSEWTNQSTSRHVRLIGDYAKAVHPDCQTVEQWNVFLKRNLRSARQLEPFNDDQIQRAFAAVIEADWITKWTLETILKFLIK